MRCAEKLGGLQNHLVYMLIAVVLGSRARIRVKIENVHNMRFCVLEWVYTSRMKNTQHQKELFYERMHSIMEFARKKKVGAEDPARKNAPFIKSSDPIERQYAKDAFGAMDVVKKKLATGELSKEPEDRRKKVLDPEFEKKVGGNRPYDPPRIRTYLKKKLIDNPVGNYAKNKEAGRQPTLYQRGVVKAFDARNAIAKKIMKNKTVSDKVLRSSLRTGQWLKRKTGEYLGKERMRALRVSAANRIKSQRRGSI